MSVIKIITNINWVLISLYGAIVVWAFLQESKPSHEMPGVESMIKFSMLFFLIILVLLNRASYAWMNITATVLTITILLISQHIATH